MPWRHRLGRIDVGQEPNGGFDLGQRAVLANTVRRSCLDVLDGELDQGRPVSRVIGQDQRVILAFHKGPSPELDLLSAPKCFVQAAYEDGAADR